MEYRLRPATLQDLRAVILWVTTPEALRWWGGPLVTFPPQAERTWGEIGANAENTFTLERPDGALAGFGQTLLRAPGKAHLARIIVAPELRGQGVGRVLCQALIAEAVARHHPAEITLNVVKSNTRAVRLYEWLGFEVVGEDKTGVVCRMRMGV